MYAIGPIYYGPPQQVICIPTYRYDIPVRRIIRCYKVPCLVYDTFSRIVIYSKGPTQEACAGSRKIHVVHSPQHELRHTNQGALRPQMATTRYLHIFTVPILRVVFHHKCLICMGKVDNMAGNGDLTDWWKCSQVGATDDDLSIYRSYTWYISSITVPQLQL